MEKYARRVIHEQKQSDVRCLFAIPSVLLLKNRLNLQSSQAEAQFVHQQDQHSRHRGKLTHQHPYQQGVGRQECVRGFVGVGVMKVMCTVKLEERLPYPLLTIKKCFVRVVRKPIEHERQQRGEKAAQSDMIFRIHQQIHQMGCCLENETSEQEQLQVIPAPPRNARQIRVDEETKVKLIDARKTLIKGHEDTLARLQKKLQKVVAKGPNSFEVKRVEIEMREINTRVSKLKQQLTNLQA